jgi:hypothetical protein
MAKAKKSKAKKSKTKKSKTKKSKAKKAVRRAAAASSRKVKKSKAVKRAAPKKTAPKKATPKKAVKKSAKPAQKAAPKKKIMGEGNYEASRKFLKDEAQFVKRHKAEIPQMGKSAEAALEGPQGGELRAAEQEAMSHSKAPGNES